MDAESIRSLFPNRSEQNLTRRLRALYDARYLDRPTQQNTMRRKMSGSTPMVYAVDREGARVLRDEHGAAVSVDRWAQKNRELRGYNIEHTLETTRFMVALERAVRARPHLELLHFDMILSRFASQKTGTPPKMALRTIVDWYGYRDQEGTAPDQIFALRYLNRKEGKNHRFLFLELDRGTETITPGEKKLKSRSFFRDTSLLRKFIIYAQAFRAGVHRNDFGIPIFQVLTVTTTNERVRQMQQALSTHLFVDKLGIRPGLFLFCDAATIAGSGDDPLACAIENGAGKTVNLVE